ncbi:MAG: amidohydrolase family protein, partial [Ferruginibacter sp.]
MLTKKPVLYSLLLIAGCLFIYSCNSRQKADLIIHHAKIYTVDEKFSVAEAMAVSGGKIIAIGTNEEILKQYESDSITDAGGKTVFPGFNDAHAHFVGYGSSLQRVDLVGTVSWDEVVTRCSEFAATLPDSAWLTGRGWDQNDWAVKDFPDNAKLNELFPNRPVLITRIDGHAAIANDKA